MWHLKKTVFVTETERNAPSDSGSMCAQNRQMTFRISWGQLFGCYFQINDDHLRPCPYKLYGTTTTQNFMLHKLRNNQYISYYFYYRAQRPQGKMYVWEIPYTLKMSSVLHSRQQNTEIHFLFLSSRPTYRLQRAHGIGTELFAERSQLPDMLHTQRLIYFGGRKCGLSYAAIGSKEIHFTHTQTETDTHTHTQIWIYVLPKTRSFFSVPKNNVTRSRQSKLPDVLSTTQPQEMQPNQILVVAFTKKIYWHIPQETYSRATSHAVYICM